MYWVKGYYIFLIMGMWKIKEYSFFEAWKALVGSKSYFQSVLANCCRQILRPNGVWLFCL